MRKKTKQNVYVVTVTYGNRYKFLKKVVKRVLDMGVRKVVIVDNNSHPDSAKKIKHLAQMNKGKVSLIQFEENKGSAGGFGAGMKCASKQKDCDFVWNLDDDNVPKKDALENLLKFWNDQKVPDKERGMALMALRYYDVGFLTKTENELKLETVEKDILMINSYCYFSIEKLFDMIKNLIQRKRKPNNLQYYRMVCGAYGGLLLPKGIFKKVGFPHAEFFTYFDDIEFTYRMYCKHDVQIYLVPSSKIDDIDMTLTNSNLKTYFPVFKILENIHTMNEKKLHYGYRNRIILEKEYLIKNEALYTLNKTIFNLLIFPVIYILYALIYRSTDTMKKLKNAIREGRNFQFSDDK